MNTIETYELKNATFSVATPTLANVDEAVLLLNAPQKLALVEHALAQWAYRKGAKKENDGKSFTLADAITDMMATRVRDGGKPSKEDVANGQQIFATLFVHCKAEDAKNPDGDLWAAVQEEIESRFARATAKYADVGGLAWSWTELEKEAGEKEESFLRRQALANMAQLAKAARLAEIRRTKGKGLASLL